MNAILRNRGAALLAALGMIAAVAGTDARAQAYPDKPVRVLVGFAAGGAADMLARAVQPGMAEALGRPFNIENLPGQGGGNAIAVAARAPGDGYTLLVANSFNITVSPALFPDAPHGLARELLPIGLIASQPYVLAVHPTLPVDSLQSLVAQARAHPGRFTFYSAGQGSPGQLAGELLKSAAGIDLGQVVYKRSAVAREDMDLGLVSLSFESPAILEPALRDGRMRALAVASARRLEMLPEVPTAEEAGVPGYRIGTWTGLFAPPGTPPAVIARVHAALRETLAEKALRGMLAKFGMDDTSTPTPADFAALVKADAQRLGQAARMPVPVVPR